MRLDWLTRLGSSPPLPSGEQAVTLANANRNVALTGSRDDTVASALAKPSRGRSHRDGAARSAPRTPTYPLQTVIEKAGPANPLRLGTNGRRTPGEVAADRRARRRLTKQQTP